jgi:hypothetical protein
MKTEYTEQSIHNVLQNTPKEGHEERTFTNVRVSKQYETPEEKVQTLQQTEGGQACPNACQQYAIIT